jgi:NADPH2:quinone reductase
MTANQSQAVKALLVDSYGDWRRVRLGEVAARQPMADQVLIETKATSLNFPDMLMIEGKYQDLPNLPFIPGRDAAGIVLSVGEHVGEFAVGDRVAVQPSHGAFAQQTISPARYCTKIPEAVSFEDAAACNTTIATVVAAISLRAKLQAGEWILITGAAGGVGSAGVQYARAIGGRVVGLVSSEEKEAAVRKLGAEIVLRSDRMADLKNDLRKALLREGLDGVDAAMDVVGGEAFDGLVRCIKPEGRIAVVGFASGRIPNVAANYLLLKDVSVIGSSINRLFGSSNPAFRRLLDAGFAMLADGRIKSTIEGRYPLGDFSKAMERVASRRVVGKILLLP